MKRRGAMYTLFAAFAIIFIIVGVIWAALSFAETQMGSTSQSIYPFGVYPPLVVTLINFGIFAMPFIILVSVAIMIIIAIQREKRYEP